MTTRNVATYDSAGIVADAGTHGTYTLKLYYDPNDNPTIGSNFTDGPQGDTLYYHINTLSNPSNQTDRAIKYENGEWSDSGGHPPTSISSGQNLQTISFDWFGSINSFANPYYSAPSGGGTGTESFDPIIENVVFTKTSDTTVSITFDWSNLTSFNVVKNGTATTVTPPTPLSSSHIQSVNVVDNDLVYIQYTNVDGITVQPPGDYTHKTVVWSIGYVSGVKSVIVKFFGSSPTPLPNTSPTFDGRLTTTKGSSIDWSYTGSLLSVSSPWLPGSIYQVKIRTTGSSTDVEDYGSSFRTSGKVFRNFW